MSGASGQFEVLLQRARGGDARALAEMLAQARPRLVEGARAALVQAGTESGAALRVVDAVEKEVPRELAGFRGSSAGEWQGWLDHLLTRKIIEHTPTTLVGNPLRAAGVPIATEPATAATAPGSSVPPVGSAPEQAESGRQRATGDTAGDEANQTLACDPAATLARPATGGTKEQDQDRTLAPPRAAATGVRPADIHSAPTMAAGGSGGKSSAASAAGKMFGDYELLGMIAKGGMGVVYKARQRKLNRVVAIKMILAGQFADELDVGRFYAEAESAANLRHPNIVGIHEVGEINGQHFFSMDYIEGKSLSDIIRENPLRAKEAAEYVRTISRAMQYAHAQGILHRDLKPSNVLVDKRNEPLITDFGLAKRVGGESQLTMSGTILGTPSYMPPEQASGKGETAGPEADVYSIGAILYELVTGTPPFRAATPYETIRQVLEREPLAPRQVNPTVPQDLETICLKCLQKEPTRRYRTAEELEAELGRFLAGEPILARPVGMLERSWRWCRRNPLIASLAAAAVLFMVLALAATTVGYVQTSRALSKSEASFRRARQVVDELFTRVSEDTLLNAPGMQPLRRELLQKALAYYEEFLDERQGDPALRDELALTLFRVGLIKEAVESPKAALEYLERAREKQEQLLAEAPQRTSRLEAMGNTLSVIGRMHQKLRNAEETIAAFQAAGRIRARLVAAEPENSEFRRLEASSHMNIGLVEMDRGNQAAAIKEIEEAQRIRNEALAADPHHVKLQRDLGKGFYNLATLQSGEAAADNFRLAIKAFEENLTDDPKNLDTQKLLILCYRLYGESMGERGREIKGNDPAVAQAKFTGAAELYERSRKLAEPLARQNPEVSEYQVTWAGVLMQLALLQVQELKQLSRAGENYEQAVVILAELAKNLPEVPEFRRDLAAAHLGLGELALAQQRPADAREHLETARGQLELLVKEFPDEKDYQNRLREVRELLAKVAKP